MWYSLEEIQKLGGFIYRIERLSTSGTCVNSFERCDSIGEFISDHSINEVKSWHEIINGRQKIKIDIDSVPALGNWFNKPSVLKNHYRDTIGPKLYEKLRVFNECDCVTMDLDDTCEHKDKLMEKFNEQMAKIPDYTNWDEYIDFIRSMFHLEYDMDLKRKDIVVCDSSDDKKFSRHIIINGHYVADHNEAYQFVNSVNTNFALPRFEKDSNGKSKDPVDMGVYKPNQGFRIAGCIKLNSNRVKKIISKHSVADTLITNVKQCIRLNRLIKCDEVEEPVAGIPAVDMPEAESSMLNIVIQIVVEQFPGMVFKNTIGNRMCFNRASPSYCTICNRAHTSDGGYVLYFEHDKLVKFYYHCRRSEKGTAGKLIYTGNHDSESNKKPSSVMSKLFS